MTRRYAVVAGGGTSGHVLPALAVARALVERGHDRRSIELFGSRRGQEATLLAGEGFPVTLLAGRGIKRSLAPRALLDNAAAVAGLAWASVWALASFLRRRPAVVVAVGGYASFPAGLGAVVARVPLVLVNTDAVPGAVNGLLGRFAAASAVGFAGTDLPRAVVTGTPVRPEFAAVDRSPEGRRRARLALGLPAERRTVAAFGGSLGARSVNRAVAGLAERWAEHGDLSLYHVTGRRDFAEVAAHDGAGAGGGEGTDPPGRLAHRVVAFEGEMATLAAASDVFVCRAGAMTVAELAVAGVPSVLVPLPGAPRDHQSENARALVAAGGAVLVPDAECDTDRLAEELAALLERPGHLEEMGRAAAALGHADAAARVAEVVDDHAR